MITTQTLETQAFDIRSIPAPPVFVHIVTLLNRSTGDEQSLQIETTSRTFVDVYRAVCWQRAEQRLFGYEIYEVLDLNDPF